MIKISVLAKAISKALLTRYVVRLFTVLSSLNTFQKYPMKDLCGIILDD